MLIHQRLQNIMQAKRTKALVRGKGKVNGNCQPRFTHHQRENIQSWYQQRKRAAQRLHTLSSGQIVLVEDGYRGDHRRHWLKDTRCKHVFRASLKEVQVVGAKAICPFCHIPTDLRRCGSLQALQEHVYKLSDGNTAFLENNELGQPDDLYEMTCLIHRYRFWTPYRDFIQKSRYVCPLCAFETWEVSDR